MFNRIAPLTLALATLGISEASAQQCVPGAVLGPEQTARRREALTATRTINNVKRTIRGVARRHTCGRRNLPPPPLQNGKPDPPRSRSKI